MPSENKQPATLMAMAAHNPAFAKKRAPAPGAPPAQGSGFLKKAGGGPGSMMGHALSGTQFGAADNLIRKAQDRFATFAGGGAVKKPAGPSAKERKEIRTLIEQGKTDAVSALRDTRAALVQQQPDLAPPEEDTDSALAKIGARLAMADGGEVEAPEEDAAPEEEQTQAGDPALMYQEYAELIEKLQDPRIDEDLREEIVDRLADIEDKLQAVGISTGDSPEE